MNESLRLKESSVSGRATGIVLAALAALFASSAGVLLRQIESAGAWTVLFYRSLGFTLTVLAFVLFRHRGATPARFKEIGWPGLFVAVSLGCGFVVFVLALMQTNVATVVAVLSVAPMLAALLAWIVLGERPSLTAWLAMFTAFAGVSIIVWDGIAAGAGGALVLSVVATIAYAGAMVGLRAGHRRDMTPAVCLSGMVACAVSLLMVDRLAITAADLKISLLLGTVQIGAQYILLTIATRFATAADTTLVMILEVILAPLWVWIFIGEAVPHLVLYGGSVILAALLLNAVAPQSASVLPEKQLTSKERQTGPTPNPLPEAVS